MENHDIHDFMNSAQRLLQEEYARIQKRAASDPGTAGDQGEENWATLLRDWLPSYFHVVTKGQILTDSGYVSPQVDVIVLVPSYPRILRDRKQYLAGGVAAAFECKTTLKAHHIKTALKTSAALRRNLPQRKGSPYRELTSTIVYGLLAHSHSWKGKKAKPIANIEKTLWESDLEYVKHPIECIDFVCVADLATWSVSKTTYLSPKLANYSKNLAEIYRKDGSASSAYLCGAIEQECQERYFSPLGVLLSGIYSKLAWNFHDMRNLEEYFRKVNLRGFGSSTKLRRWDVSIYSEAIRDRVYQGHLADGSNSDEWSIWF